MNKFMRYYREARALGFTAACAIEDARTRCGWDELLEENLVKLEIVPDNVDCDLSWLDQDCYKGDRGGRAMRKRLLDIAKSDGLFGCVGYWRLNDDDEWRQGGSVWGFIGSNDARNNCYIPDLMRETMDCYWRAALRMLRQS